METGTKSNPGVTAAGLLGLLAGALAMDPRNAPPLEFSPFRSGGRMTQKIGRGRRQPLRGYYNRYTHSYTEFFESTGGNGLTATQRKRQRKADAESVKAINGTLTRNQQRNARLNAQNVPMYPTRRSRFSVRRYVP